MKKIMKENSQKKVEKNMEDVDENTPEGFLISDESGRNDPNSDTKEDPIG